MNKYSKTYAKYRSQVKWRYLTDEEISTEEFHDSIIEFYPIRIQKIVENGFNPSEKSQLIVVKEYPTIFTMCIELGLRPYDSVLFEGVRNWSFFLEDILDLGIVPSYEMFVEHINRHNDYTVIMKMIKNGYIPSEEIQLEYVRKKSFGFFSLITSGIKPTESVQLLAVKNYPSDINYIKNPSQQVIKVYENETNQKYNPNNYCDLTK